MLEMTGNQDPLPSLTSLPDDLIYHNILTRVPAKSVGRFRCVSKRWRSPLTKEFKQFHLKQILNNKESTGIIVGNIYGYCSLNIGKESNIVVSKWWYRHEITSLCGSCNGLVLGLQGNGLDSSLMLFNPITLQTRSIPCIPKTFQYGLLASDGINADYKILAVSQANQGGSDVSIYSLRTNTWRILGKVPYQYFMHEEGCCFNGAYHYLAGATSQGDFRLVSFSPSLEQFKEVPYPKELEPYRHYTWAPPILTVVRGCLALVWGSRPDKDGYDLWVMKEYGVQDSWEKKRLPIQQKNWIYKYLGVLADENLVFKRSDDTLVVVSLDSWVPQIVTLYEGNNPIGDIRPGATSPFIETLISVKEI